MAGFGYGGSRMVPMSSLDLLDSDFGDEIKERRRFVPEDDLSSVSEGDDDNEVPADSFEALHHELRQMQAQSDANQHLLQQAAMNGQRLLHEEFQFQNRLSHLHAELTEGERSSFKAAPPEREFSRRRSSIDWVDSMDYGDEGMHSPHHAQSAATKKAHQKILHDTMEVERLRDLNVSIEEDILEKEIALMKKKAEPLTAGGDTGDNSEGISPELKKELHEMHTKLLASEEDAQRSSDARERELEDWERAVIETRRHSTSARSIIVDRLEETQYENVSRSDELAAASEKRVEATEPFLGSIEKLRLELKEARELKEKADVEIQETHAEVAELHAAHAEWVSEHSEALEDAKKLAWDRAREPQEQDETSQTQKLTREMVEGRRCGARADVMGLLHRNTAQEDSDGSEYWDDGGMSQATTETDATHMSSRNFAALESRRRQLRGLRNVYKEMAVVVNTAHRESADEDEEDESLTRGDSEETLTKAVKTRGWAALKTGYAAAPTAAETAAAAAAAAETASAVASSAASNAAAAASALYFGAAWAAAAMGDNANNDSAENIEAVEDGDESTETASAAGSPSRGWAAWGASVMGDALSKIDEVKPKRTRRRIVG